MAKLRVNTATLKSMAKNIDLAGRDLYKAKSSLTAKGASARTYEQNSFGPRVRVICQQAARHADDRADVLDALSIQLSTRAKLYDNADNKFLKNLLSKLVLLYTSKTNKELKDVSSLSSLAKKKSSAKSSNDDIVEQKPDKENIKQVIYSSVASLVPTSPSKGNNYKREGYSEYGSPASNCVFYAWEAVYYTSGVKLPFTGDAVKWIDQAEPAGYKVDTNPQPGDVIWFSFNHVGFIENVRVENGKTLVTWSEEQADGKAALAWGKDNVTEVDGVPLRWRVKAKDLSSYFNDNRAKVIHIKNNNQ